MTVTSAALPPTPAGWRSRAWPGRIFDLGVVFGLLVVGAAIVLSSTHEVPHLGEIRLPLYVAVAVPLAALLLRRRYPLATLGVILAALVAEAFLHSPTLVQPLVLVGVYTVASRVPWRLSVVLTALSAHEELPRGRCVMRKPLDPPLLLDLAHTLLQQDERLTFTLNEAPSDLMPRRRLPA